MHRFVILIGFIALIAKAEVKLPAVFSDHMVLQRSNVTPVWGWAEPGEKIKVQFADQIKNVFKSTSLTLPMGFKSPLLQSYFVK